MWYRLSKSICVKWDLIIFTLPLKALKQSCIWCIENLCLMILPRCLSCLTNSVTEALNATWGTCMQACVLNELNITTSASENWWHLFSMYFKLKSVGARSVISSACPRAPHKYCQCNIQVWRQIIEIQVHQYTLWKVSLAKMNPIEYVRSSLRKIQSENVTLVDITDALEVNGIVLHNLLCQMHYWRPREWHKHLYRC